MFILSLIICEQYSVLYLQLSIVSKLVEEEKCKKKQDKQLSQSHWQYQYESTTAFLPAIKVHCKYT